MCYNSVENGIESMHEVKHKRLYEILKAEILAGTYGQPRAFPSEAQLSRRLGSSRTTVRRALDELRHEGLIRCRQGRGTVVTEWAKPKTFGLIVRASTQRERKGRSA